MSADQTPALARATEWLHQNAGGDYGIGDAHDLLSAALHDPSVTHVLALHQIESHGMGPSTPDGCACGERVTPAPHQSEYEDISSRRGRAFAEHQAAALVAAILGEAS